jgi:hypothetical protein
MRHVGCRADSIGNPGQPEVPYGVGSARDGGGAGVKILGMDEATRTRIYLDYLPW